MWDWAISTYFAKMVFPALAGAVLWALFRPWRKRRRAAKSLRAGPFREGGLLVLSMFLAALLWLTLTPPDMDYFLQTGSWLYGEPFQGGLNLVPVRESLRLFRFYLKHNMWGAILINFPGNIVMFLPFGLFAGLLMDKPRWWKSVLITVLLSALIEFFQLFVSRGTDIDDLILNAMGGLLGHWVWLMIARFAPTFVEKFKCVKVVSLHE